MLRTTNPSNSKTKPPKAPAPPDLPAIPASDIQACLDSALFWVEALPRFARRMQLTADIVASSAALLGVLTGLAVWTRFVETGSIGAQISVTIVAILGGGLAAVPRIFNYGEMAGSARSLTSRYARSSGELRRYWEHPDWLDKPQAETAIETFQAIKEAKDQLRYLPKRPNGPRTRDDRGYAIWTERELNGRGRVD